MSNNTKTYLIRLTPLNYYFFGGERTFGSANEENYLVESRRFPQQTTLLGCMRYRILVDNLLDGKENVQGKKLPKDAEKWIGEHGFQKGHLRQYGCIQSLSALFLHATNRENRVEHFYPAAFNRKHALEKEDTAQAALDMRYQTTSMSFAPKLKDYDPKEGWNTVFISTTGKVLTYEDIFQEHAQIGIQKDFKGTQNKAFFKQTSYGLKQSEDRKLAFAFYLTLSANEKGVIPEPKNNIIQMGGERSLFNMEVSQQEAPKIQLHPAALPKDKYTKIVLLSDAYIDPKIHQYCDFSIVQTIPFRYLETKVTDTENYFDLHEEKKEIKNEKKGKVRKSKRSNLVKRGSIFYPKKGKRTEVIQFLEEQIAFRNIGYNQYFLYPENN